MVTVNTKFGIRNRVVVRCPICSVFINRDTGHWSYHMLTTHNVVYDELDSPTYGGETSGLTDRVDTKFRYGNHCYGCGSYFTSKDDLISHLQTSKIVTEDQGFYLLTEDGDRLIQE